MLCHLSPLAIYHLVCALGRQTGEFYENGHLTRGKVAMQEGKMCEGMVYFTPSPPPLPRRGSCLGEEGFLFQFSPQV